MDLSFSIYAGNLETEKKWSEELKLQLKSYFNIQVSLGSQDQEMGQIILIDGSMPGIEIFIEKLNRNNRAILLVLNETSIYPNLLREGKLDDILVYPFRSLEILSKIRNFEQLQMWNEVSHLNASFSELIQKMKVDLELGERLHKAKLPRRFQDIKGFKVLSRYLAGLKSGGDYFDLAESRDGGSLSVFLSDSSSYGLSGAVLSTLMRVVLKVSTERMSKAGGTIETVGLIYDDLLLTLGEREQLSLFFGTIFRQEKKLRYVNLGNSLALYAKSGEKFVELASHGSALSRFSGFTAKIEHELDIDSDGRLVLISQGFVDEIGGVTEITKILNDFRTKEPVDSINEFVFRAKSKLKEKDDMPARDCTILVLDADGKILKFNKN